MSLSFEAYRMTFESETIQELRNPADLVGFGAHSELSQADALLTCIGAKEMKAFGAGGSIKAVPQSLAVNGYELWVKLAMRAPHKCQEAPVKCP